MSDLLQRIEKRVSARLERMKARIGRQTTSWREMGSAPRDGTHILILTSDFGVVEGWWNVFVPNFYKSRVGWASYDPDNAQGDWVSEWSIGSTDEYNRLFCGLTPKRWLPIPKKPLICSSCGHDIRPGDGDDEGGWSYHDVCLYGDPSPTSVSEE